MKIILGNATAVHDAVQRTQRQLLASVVWDGDLVAGRVVAPLLVTASLGDLLEAISPKDPYNLISGKSGESLGH